jgi:hypothetical protein
MEQFTKPENLNGGELRNELRSAGIEIGEEFDAVMVNDGSILSLKINTKDKAKAQEIVSAHNGTVIGREATIAEKLASVGLSLEELKAALGGN